MINVTIKTHVSMIQSRILAELKFVKILPIRMIALLSLAVSLEKERVNQLFNINDHLQIE